MLNTETAICLGIYLNNCCMTTPITRTVQEMELQEKEAQKD